LGNEEYYGHVRRELIVNITSRDNRVLEVGCAEGSTCYELKTSGRASETVGVEINPDAAQKAAKKIDHVICGDVESLEFGKHPLIEASFDYIICGDVLEHLKDPWRQLERLLKLLKPGGMFICSLPNVRYYAVSLRLVFGDDWTYTNAGILDSTHLRFFTRSTGMKMLAEAGLEELSSDPLIHKRRDKLVFKGSIGLFAGLVTPQWILKGIKPT